MVFYKNSAQHRAAPEATWRGEPGLDLANAEAAVATDYTKRQHVFRLKLDDGCDYLFQVSTYLFIELSMTFCDFFTICVDSFPT